MRANENKHSFTSSLKNPQGSALITVMAVTVMVSLLVAGLVILLSHSLKNQTSRKEAVEFNLLLRTIKAQLANPQICSNTLLDSQSVKSKEQDITLQNFKIGDSAPFKVNEIVYNNFKLKKVQLITPVTSPVYSYDIQIDKAEPPRKTYEGYLLITVETPTGKLISNTTAMRAVFEQLPIYYNLAGGKIQSCYGPQSVAHYCEQLGGAWNEGEPDPFLRCNPNVKCFTKNLLDPASCKKPYTSTQIGFASSPIYLCQWCNSFRKN